MNQPDFKDYLFFGPLSFLYGMGVGFRNMLFEIGALRTKKYVLPIISVGNITVGGTGKTPHVEYILNILKVEGKVAMLSRGYKRKTKGYVLADEKSTASTIGDEPYQVKNKFSDVLVAVDKNRRRGISNLQKSPWGKELCAIVLDDAFQHRYVEPGINILLTDFSRPLTEDHLLPLGRLREPVENKKRANVVIVTKCPDTAQPIDFRLVTKALDLKPYQDLFFTKYVYEDLRPAYPADAAPLSVEQVKSDEYSVLLFTGIVSQHNMADHLLQYAVHLESKEFADHHRFNVKDFALLDRQFQEMKAERKIFVTTEKDAARLSDMNVPESIRRNLYVLPIKVHFLFDQEDDFKKRILGYVAKNKTNRRLFEK